MLSPELLDVLDNTLRVAGAFAIVCFLAGAALWGLEQMARRR